MGFDFSIIDVDELNALTGENRDEKIMSYASTRTRRRIKVVKNKNKILVTSDGMVKTLPTKGRYSLEGFTKPTVRKISTGYVSNVSDTSPEIRLLCMNGVAVASPRFSRFHKSTGVETEYSPQVLRTLRRIYDEVSRGSLSPLTNLAPFIRRAINELTFLTEKVPAAYKLLVGLANVAKKISASYETYLSWIYDLHGAVTGADVSCSEEGHYIISPPGTGKTLHNHLWSLGLIDCDGLDRKVMVEDPQVFQRLLTAGFSVISNRWEWNHVATPVYIGPKFEDLQDQMRKQGIFAPDDPMLSKLRSSILTVYKGVKRRSDKPPHKLGVHKEVRDDLPMWLEKYKDIFDTVPTYICNVDSFLEAYSDFLDDLLG